MQQHCIANFIQKKPLSDKNCGGCSPTAVVCCCPSIQTIALLHSSARKLLTRNPVCTGCNSAHTSHPVQFSLHQCNFSGAQCTGNMAAQCRWCAIFYLHGHWRSMLVIVWCSLTSCSWLQSWRLQYQQCDNLPSVWMNIMRIEG